MQKPSLHQRWEGFRGERTDGDKPMFSVKRSSIIGRSRTTLTVEVYDNPGVEYLIEGCFPQRCCKIYNSTRKLVAEIRRKVDPTTSVMLGKEVFMLCVQPGFDGSFAMGLVLVLDQINGENFFDSGITTEPAVHPATEDWGRGSLVWFGLVPFLSWDLCLFQLFRSLSSQLITWMA